MPAAEIKDLTAGLPPVLQAIIGAVFALFALMAFIRGNSDRKASPDIGEKSDPFSLWSMQSFHLPQAITMMNEILSILRQIHSVLRSIEGQNERAHQELSGQTRSLREQTEEHKHLMAGLRGLLQQLVDIKSREERGNRQ